MAHTCPECGSYCTCQGDWDDVDFGIKLNCICCIESDDYDDDDSFDEYDDALNDNIKTIII